MTVQPFTPPAVGWAHVETVAVVHGIWSVTRRYHARAADVLVATIAYCTVGYDPAATSPGTGIGTVLEMFVPPVFFACCAFVSVSPGTGSSTRMLDPSVSSEPSASSRASLAIDPVDPSLYSRSPRIHGSLGSVRAAVSRTRLRSWKTRSSSRVSGPEATPEPTGGASGSLVRAAAYSSNVTRTPRVSARSAVVRV